MQSIYQVADKYQGKYRGIAVCAPGKIDTEHKIIYFGGALPFLDGLNLQETLGEKYKVPVSVENDGKAAALAEQWHGELQDIDDGVRLPLEPALVAEQQLIIEQFMVGHFKPESLAG